MVPEHLGFTMATTTLVLTFKPKLQDKTTNFRVPVPITHEAGCAQDTEADVPGHQRALSPSL